MSERLTPEELRSRANDVGMLGSLDAHGFLGGRIREGRALRVLFRKGRKFDDLVLFQSADGEMDGVGAPPGGEFEVLSASTFSVLSESGPVVVEDRVLPTRFEDPVGWVEKALSGVELEGWALDPPPRALMSDEEFWGLIGLLDGSLDDDDVALLSEALEDLPYREILQFNDTLAARLHELDHPGNAVRLGEGDDVVVSADASLYYRCEIIAQGRRSFLDHIEHPRVDFPDAGAEGEVLLGIASDASPSPLLDPETIFETGFNKTHWPDAPDPAPHPSTTIPSPGPFSYDVQLSRLQLAPSSRRRFVSWVAYITTTDGAVREVMGCVMHGTVASARLEIVPFLMSMLRDGEHLHPNVIVYRPGVDGITIGVGMVGVTRRSKLTMRDYIDTYYTGALPLI